MVITGAAQNKFGVFLRMIRGDGSEARVVDAAMKLVYQGSRKSKGSNLADYGIDIWVTLWKAWQGRSKKEYENTAKVWWYKKSL